MGWSCRQNVRRKTGREHADAQKVEGKWRRSRSKLQCRIAFKVTQKEWKKKGKMTDRRNWRLLTKNIVSKRETKKKTMKKELMV